MMGTLHKLLWCYQILVTLQSPTVVGHDASLSNVEALASTHKSRIKTEVTQHGTGKGSFRKKPNDISIIKRGNGDFCENRESGVHPEPSGCRGFILCDAGKTYRKKCAPGLLFNSKHLVCDLPARVKCRRGSHGRPSAVQKRGKLNLPAKPTVEIVIQKEKTQDTQTAPSNMEGIQAIRPNEETEGIQNVNLEAGSLNATYESRGVVMTTKGDRRANESTSEGRKKTGSAKNGSTTVLNTNSRTSSRNNGQDSSHKGGPQSTASEAQSLVGRVGELAEKGGGQATPTTGSNGTQGLGTPVRGTTNAGTGAFQSGIVTTLPHKLGNRYVLHEGRADTLGIDANGSTNASAAKGQQMALASQQGGELETTLNTVEAEKQGIAASQSGTSNGVSIQGPQKGPVNGGSLQALNARFPLQQGAHVLGEQLEPNVASERVEETAVSSHGAEAAVLSSTEAEVVTLEGLGTSGHSKPAVSKNTKEKSAPLVGITIKQTGHPDKYVLVNKRHKLHTKHHTHLAPDQALN